MDVMFERVAGLDVHKAMIIATVRIILGGKVKRECRSFETTTSGLLDLSAWLTASGCTHVAMEATGVYWKPVWSILSDGKFELILANAAHIKNVPGHKTDVNDATWISDLLACGLIKASFVPTTEIQDLRSLQRARKQLTREQTRHTQRIQKTLEEANIKLDGDQRHHGCVRPQDDRGYDRWRQEHLAAGGFGRPTAEGHAQAAL
jgi:transposase